MKKYYQALSSVFGVVLTLTVMLWAVMPSFTASAASTEFSLTVSFVGGDDKNPIPVKGSEVKLYRALDYEGNLTSDFAKHNITVGDLKTAEDVMKLTTTLENYSSDIKPMKTATTAVNGKVTFNDLQKGIYLVVCTPVVQDKVKYTPKASLVRVPYYAGQGQLVKDAKISIKNESDPLPEDPIKLSVKKEWDDNNSSKRPKNVTIELRKNGAVDRTITLSASNKWQHTWTNLDPNYTWTVTEKDVSGYTVSETISTDKDGVTLYTITNTAEPEVPDDPSTSDEPSEDPSTSDEPSEDPSTSDEPSEDPSTSDEPSEDPSTSDEPSEDPSTSDEPSDDPSTSDEPSDSPGGTTSFDTGDTGSDKGSSDTPTDSVTPPEPQLPQTGQLWWPVPVLLIVGMAIVLTGILVKNLGCDEEEK